MTLETCNLLASTTFWGMNDNHNGRDRRARVGAAGAGAHGSDDAVISIRASTWDATSRSDVLARSTRFQSERPRGARFTLCCTCCMFWMFQFTRSCGARPSLSRRESLAGRGFNSLARVGVRPRQRRDVGQSRPRLNPRARVGRDQIAASTAARSFGFNPRTRVGRDAIGRRGTGGGAGFNPRARVGRDCPSLTSRFSKISALVDANMPRGTCRALAICTQVSRVPFAINKLPFCEPPGFEAVAWGSHAQKTRGPLRSRATLAPTCSTFRSQFAPSW